MLNKPLRIKFKYNKQPVKLMVMPPTYKQEQELKTVYAVAFRQCIKKGVATRPSMLELMRKENLWGNEQEGELTNLTIELALLEQALIDCQEDGSGIDKEKEIAIKLAGTRSKVYELVSIKTLPLEYTAEEIANDVKIDAFIALCTYPETASRPYYRNHEEFIERRNDTDSEKIYEAVISELSRYNMELLIKLPEHQWLIEHKYMDKEGQLVTEVEEEIAEKSGIKESVFVDELEKKE